MPNEPTTKQPVRVLFVCMANICRSPMAHAVFEEILHAAEMTDQVKVDSAGVRSKDKRKPPDPRAVKVAEENDYEMLHLRSRRTMLADYADFDYIVTMDAGVQERVMDEKPENSAAEVALLLDYAQGIEQKEVPDPYYSKSSDFQTALYLIEEGCFGLFETIIQRHFAGNIPTNG